MPRRKKIPRARIGVDIGTVQRKIKKALEGTPAADVWKEEFEKQGLPVFQAWLEHALPYIYALATDPDMTEEQRQVAVKEWFRRKRQVEPAINSRLVEVAKMFAMRTTATVVKPGAKPVPPAPLIV